MKYTREMILRRAFDVFMDKGYDSASITVLQKELDMSRGALYRYFKSKEELFFSVLDEYFFKVFEKLAPAVGHNMTIPEFNESFCRRQQMFVKVFLKAGVSQVAFLNYTALIIQGAKHYPGFIQKYFKVAKRIEDNWEIAVRNSLAAGEIRPDIDVEKMKVILSRVESRDEPEDNNDPERIARKAFKGIKQRKELVDYIYELMKV